MGMFGQYHGVARVTVWIIFAVAGLLIFWDVYAGANSDKGDTITEIIRAAAARHPIIPFALGVVMGHLFWSGT